MTHQHGHQEKHGVTITTTTGFEIEYQVNSSTGTWVKDSSPVDVNNLNHNDIIYARLTDGTNSSNPATVTIVDAVKPKVTLSLTAETSKITAAATAQDSESGIASDAIYTFYLKEGSLEYVQVQASTSKTCDFTGLTQGTNYTVKVEVEDKAGNVGLKEQTISTKQVPSGTVEGAISFSSPTWASEKATVTISTNTSYQIEYQVNSTSGSWVVGTTVSNLNHNDVIYARLTDGTNAGNYINTTIKDTVVPSQASITTSDVTYEKVTVTITTASTDNETGLKDYTYVAEKTDGTKVEVKNQTALTATITGLSEQTDYKIYVIAYDNAGNAKKSNEETIKTEATPPVSNPNEDNTFRSGNELSFTWQELGEIAQIIANNSSTITSNTKEAKIAYKGTQYTIGVGDYTAINGKKVRILGFNHDELTDKTVYQNEDGSENTTAGISFEYVDILTTAAMNSSETNLGGWKSSAMYTTLNTTQYNSLPDDVKGVIKQVKKAYCATYNSSTLSYSDDYLWLLSCAEIWGVQAKAPGVEGLQYKYYKNIGATYSSTNDKLVKKSGSRAYSWWLRSPGYPANWDFCFVDNDGDCAQYACKQNYGVAPGFSI